MKRQIRRMVLSVAALMVPNLAQAGSVVSRIPEPDVTALIAISGIAGVLVALKRRK